MKFCSTVSFIFCSQTQTSSVYSRNKRFGLGTPVLSVETVCTCMCSNMYLCCLLYVVDDNVLCIVAHRLKMKCSLCRMIAPSVSGACWSVKLERLRPLTRRACALASATWCWLTSPPSHSTTAFLERHPTGLTRLFPRVPSGALARALAISTKQIREERLASRSGEHLSQEQHLRSGAMQRGASWGLCQRVVGVWP